MSNAGTQQGPQDASDEQAGEPSLLDRLKSVLGLAEGQDLRGVIGDALKNEPEATTSFSQQERAMLRNILRIGTLRVEDVMVPRADIIAVDEVTPLAELLRVFERAGHSRVPVYNDTLDDPRGMVHIKDLMSWITGQSAPKGRKSNAKKGAVNLAAVDLSLPLAKTKIWREVLFVPPSMSVVDLLLRMQTTRIHLALVVDEYGGTDGLVSIEDLVEEIVGEIEDEHDVNGGPLIRDDATLGLIADARATISQLEEHLGESIQAGELDDDIDTLGGLVFTLLGRVPVRGEIVPHANLIEFEVLDADPRRIKKLRIHRQIRVDDAADRAGGDGA
jgi:CBS domain containing-hemolysin-like protein